MDTQWKPEAVETLLHIHIEDFITYPWIQRFHFLEFICSLQSPKTKIISKLAKISEKMQIEGEQHKIPTIYYYIFM